MSDSIKVLQETLIFQKMSLKILLTSHFVLTPFEIFQRKPEIKETQMTL